MDSIRIHGVLQPVVVRRAGDRFELVVGERRWRAAKLAGLESMPAVVLEIDPRDRLEVALVENIQRRDLNPIELAVAFRALADGGSTQEEIGERVGMDRSSVSNHLRLLELSPDLQSDVGGGPAGHRPRQGPAGGPEPGTSPHAAGPASSKKGSRCGRPSRWARPPAPRKSADSPRPAQDPHLQSVGDALRQHLQTRVRIKGDGERGRIEVEYFGAEDFERLTGLLLGERGGHG